MNYCERDIDRIDLTLSAINNIWKRYPDLRLGQLLLNAVPEEKLYNVEEDELLKALEHTYSTSSTPDYSSQNGGTYGN